MSEVVERVLAPADADRRGLRVAATGLRVADGRLALQGERFALRPLPARQLRALAGVPARSPSVELRRALAARGERDVFVRLDGRVVRAVLGASFVPLDDLDVFSRVARAIEAMGWRDDLCVSFVGMSERVTVVRCVLRSSSAEVRRGDAFLRGLQVTNSETGCAAFSLTPLVTRVACWNTSLASRPRLRLAHVGPRHRLDRDWRIAIADVLDAARALIDGWRSSAIYEDANAITDAAKARPLAARITQERRAQRVVEDSRQPDPRYG